MRKVIITLTPKPNVTISDLDYLHAITHHLDMLRMAMMAGAGLSHSNDNKIHVAIDIEIDEKKAGGDK